MTNDTTQHTPADVRERVARECVEEAERLGRWYGEGYAKARSLLREAAALILTPRGDEEAWRAFLDAVDEFEAAAASLWADPSGPTAEDIERLDRARQRVIECGRALAGLRSDAQGGEDVGEFCDLCGEEFDPREPGTVIGPLGQDDGVPRWYRCPRCARAYDAGYQQGQRDPRGDETADPTALRSEAQGEDGRDSVWVASAGVVYESGDAVDAFATEDEAVAWLKAQIDEWLRERLQWVEDEEEIEEIRSNAPEIEFGDGAHVVEAISGEWWKVQRYDLRAARRGGGGGK